MNPNEKPLFLLPGVTIQTPPMGAIARREAGFLLGRLQAGEILGMPQARPLFDIAPGLYELRVRDRDANWRLFYRVDTDRILLIHQISKKTQELTKQDKDLVKDRLDRYDEKRAEMRKAEESKKSKEGK